MQFSDKFMKCYKIVFKEEKGYSNHPSDPGGPTMDGVTQTIYDNYRKDKGFTERPVKLITYEEKLEIYHDQYWVPVNGDKLPNGLSLAVFDYGFNSGPVTSIKSLQSCLGVDPDGHIGFHTMQKIKDIDEVELIESFCDRRMKYLRRLKNWSVFGKGWEGRVNRIAKISIAMAKNIDVINSTVKDDAPKGIGRSNPNPNQDSSNDKIIAIGTGASGIVATILNSISSPYGVVALGMILAVICFAAWKMWPKERMPEL